MTLLTRSNLRRWFRRAGCVNARSHTRILVRDNGRLPRNASTTGEWCALTHPDDLPGSVSMRVISPPTGKRVRLVKPWAPSSARDGRVRNALTLAPLHALEPLTRADMRVLTGRDVKLRACLGIAPTTLVPRSREYPLLYASTPAITTPFADRGIYTLV